MSRSTEPQAQDDSCFIDPSASLWLDLDGAPPQRSGKPHQIEVKAELGFAEEQSLKASLYRAMRGADDEQGGQERQVVVDVKRHAIDTVRTWVIAWTLTGAGGKPMDVTRDAIEHLRPVFSDAIVAALDRHIEQVEAGKAVLSGTAS